MPSSLSDDVQTVLGFKIDGHHRTTSVILAAEEKLPRPRSLGTGTDAVPPPVMIRRRTTREADHLRTQLLQGVHRIQTQTIIVGYRFVVADPNAVQQRPVVLDQAGV